MTKVIASGIVEGLNLYSPEGKTYKLADLTVGGRAFKGIFKRPQGLADGMNVEVIEHPIPAGKKYAEKEIRLAAGALPVAASAPVTQPGRAPVEQDKISRQWATTQAIGFVTLAAQQGALKKKITENETLLFQLVGSYANLLFNSVQSGSNFEKMPQFTGHVNEVSETTGEAQ